MTLAAVNPAELTPLDLSWLAKGCHKLSTGETAAWFVQQAIERKAQLWRWREGRGMVATEISTYPGGKKLNITMVSGIGMAANQVEIMSTLREFARSEGCDKLTGVALDSRLERWYRRMGAKPIGTLVSLEV